MVSNYAADTSGAYKFWRGFAELPTKACDVKEITNLQRYNRRVVFALCFCTLSLIILILFLLRQPSMKYDRALDDRLSQFIYTSDAASKLPLQGSLFCWVMTSKKYHDSRALAINETWLHRCDHGQMFTNDVMSDENIPYSTVFAGIPDTYENLFFKTRYAFHHIYTNISSSFDWYMKADDDTYVIVEHLRSYLATLDPNKPYYLGYLLRPYLENGYNAGGAGYVLSKEALRLFNEYAYPNETLCPNDIYEDVGMARCLANVGLLPSDTRNKNGQQRFNTFTPMEMFHGKFVNDEYPFYKLQMGYDAFPADLISYHHLQPDDIRLFEILLYRVNKPKT